MISPGDIEGKQERNKNRIINFIRKNPGVSRQNCAVELSISTYTASKLVNQLIENSIIYEDNSIKPETPGRPMKPLYVNADHSYFIGIDFDTQKWRFVILNFAGKSVYEAMTVIPVVDNQKEFLNILNDFLSKQKESIKKYYNKIESLCIGAPGFVDRAKGYIRSFELLPFLEEIPLIDIAKSKIDKPVYITHNIYNLAYSDAYRLKEYKDRTTIHVVVRSGISACISNGGKPSIGKHYLAGEIGLTDIGQGVFLQDIAGLKALQKMIPDLPKQFWEGDIQSIEDVYSQNKEARKILKRAMYAIARVLGNIQAFTDSDEIVLYCPFIKSNTKLWHEFCEKFNQQLDAKGLYDIKVNCIDDSEMELAKSAALFVLQNQYPETIEDKENSVEYLLKN